MTTGDLVGLRDVKGTRGRVVAVDGDRALVKWVGYPTSATWTPVDQLLVARVHVHEATERFDQLLTRR